MTQPPDSNPESTAQEPGFDARLRKLEELVRRLEEGDLELEPAIEHYKEGVALLKGCREILGSYRSQVEELTKDAEAGVAPYAGDPDLGASSGPNPGSRRQ